MSLCPHTGSFECYVVERTLRSRSARIGSSIAQVLFGDQAFDHPAEAGTDTTLRSWHIHSLSQIDLHRHCTWSQVDRCSKDLNHSYMSGSHSLTLSVIYSVKQPFRTLMRSRTRRYFLPSWHCLSGQASSGLLSALTTRTIQGDVFWRADLLADEVRAL